MARAEAILLGPQLLYDICSHMDRMGWAADKKNPPGIVEEALCNAYCRLLVENHGHSILELDFWSSTKLSPSFQSYGGGLTVTQLVSLKQQGGPALCLQARLSHSHNKTFNTFVKLGGEWIEFVEFADLLLLASTADPGKTKITWELGSKISNLLLVPLALREEVFAYTVFFDKHFLDLPDNQRLQEMREDARTVLWTRGSFRFKSVDNFSELFLDAKFDDLQKVRKMELNFGYEDWLRILGAQLTSHVRFTACRSLSVIKSAQLHELKLVFREPSDLERAPFRLWNSTGGCHTKVLLWILKLLTPIIGHASIKKLEVEGFITHAQKANFYKKIEMFKDMLKEPDITLEDLKEDGDEEGGVSLLGPREQAILALPDFQVANETTSDELDPEGLYPTTRLPPICLCKHECTLDADEFMEHLDDDDMGILGY
ncbi:hypothetical protein EG328_009830 [Venturia inaequalis]|uniref:Uncharacterized protein n=1 Tax=Venturia inaequalis TaxID=5025 RepID=A0A8H3U892_VENIN|nr:hypothetical protein EG328_009830 [Venturia inaequalis]